MLSSLAALTLLSAAPIDLPKGRLIEKVECAAGAGQSYALYLPSRYDPARAWPILYCFDAGARGRLAVERFREAAEQYGYIVAGSNNSRNGPTDRIVAALKAIWDDTQSRFAIDAKRMYAAGFSGGARVALDLGRAAPLAGVVACGAAFVEGKLAETPRFAFYGLAGTDDFNMPEFRQTDRTLDPLRVPHRIRQFDGGHDWPPAPLCTEAIDWMELQAMKAGIRARDEVLVDSLFAKASSRIASGESDGRGYEAWAEAESAADAFRGLRDVSGFESNAAKWRQSREVKAALKREEQTERRQNEFSLRLARLDYGLASLDQRQQSASALRSLLSDLNRDKQAGEDTPARRAARRALLWFHISLRDEAAQALAKGDYALAAARLEIATEAEPARYGTYYELAVAWAQSGQKRKAIGALRTAVAKGARDTAAWAADPRLAPLRGDSEFAAICAASR